MLIGITPVGLRSDIYADSERESDGISQDNIMQSHLLETLINNYVRLTSLGDASFVLQKLCSTIANLFHRLSDSTWPSPIRHIAACLLGGQYVQQASTPDISVIINSGALQLSHTQNALARFVLTLAEDSKGFSVSQQTKSYMSDNCLEALLVLSHFLGVFCSYEDVQQVDGVQLSTALAETCLQALPVSLGHLRHSLY
jgi:hypothetical protein